MTVDHSKLMLPVAGVGVEEEEGVAVEAEEGGVAVSIKLINYF